MASTSLILNMNLPIAYNGPLQTNLECLHLHKRRITQNYKRVMERIFFDTRVAPERPVMVKIFDDRMEFYPLYGRKVPISELRYVDVLSVLPSRDDRKVYVVAIPAKDNTKGIWIIGMRFHQEDPDQYHGARSNSSVLQMPSLKAPIEREIFELTPSKPKVLKEKMTSVIDIREKIPTEQANMETYCICTLSPTKRDTNPHRPLEVIRSEEEMNIKTTKIIIDGSVGKLLKKFYLESNCPEIPENLNNKAYIRNNSPLAVPDGKEYCEEFKEPLDGEYRRKKLCIKNKANSDTRSTIKFPKSVAEDIDIGKESELCTISRKDVDSTRRFIVRPLEGVTPKSPTRCPLDGILVPFNKPSKSEGSTLATRIHDGHMKKIVVIKEDISDKVFPGWRLIPGKEVKIFQSGPASRKDDKSPERHHKADHQTRRRRSISSLGDGSENPGPVALKIIMNSLLEEQSKEKDLDQSNSFKVKITSVPLEDSGAFSIEDGSSESSSGAVEKKMTTVMSLKVSKNLTDSKEINGDKDFILRKEMKTDFMFLPEKSFRSNQLLLTKPGEKVLSPFNKFKIIPLENDILSKLQCQRSREESKYQEDKIIIIREEICSDCESLSSWKIKSSDKPINMDRKSHSPESIESLRFSSINSEMEVGTLRLSSRDRFGQSIGRRSHSRHSINELTEIDKSVRRNRTEGNEVKESTRICPCCCHGACCTLENCACVPSDEHPRLKQISSHRPKFATLSPPMKSTQILSSPSALEGSSRPLPMIPAKPMKINAKRIAEQYKSVKAKTREMKFQAN